MNDIVKRRSVREVKSRVKARQNGPAATVSMVTGLRATWAGNIYSSPRFARNDVRPLGGMTYLRPGRRRRPRRGCLAGGGCARVGGHVCYRSRSKKGGPSAPASPLALPSLHTLPPFEISQHPRLAGRPLQPSWREKSPTALRLAVHSDNAPAEGRYQGRNAG